ncbi:hypothetical protein [Bacillus cereus]|nr:hypothetical protein [Bacillus cereus]
MWIELQIVVTNIGKVQKLITSHEEKALRRTCSDKFLEEAPIAGAFFFAI